MLRSQVSVLRKNLIRLLSYSNYNSFMTHKYIENLIPPTEEGIAYGASLIRAGELVSFPTETVYGLGANALNAEACTSIFRAKGRPMTDPLIVHVSEPSMAESLISVDENTGVMFRKLSEEFWPGPLTIIVNADPCVPSEVTAKTGFVGIRCPNHPLALSFISACGCPVAAPSANLFGHVSPTLACHVLDDLGSKGVRVMDGDSQHSLHTCLHGIESTVVRLETVEEDKYQRNVVTILRHGAVSQAQLTQFVECENAAFSPEETWFVRAIQRQVQMEDPQSHESATTIDENKKIQGGESSTGEVAPGQSVTHYAPYIPCFVVESCISELEVLRGFNDTNINNINKSDTIVSALERYKHHVMKVSITEFNNAVILDFGGQLAHYSSQCLAYRDLSPTKNSVDAARVLFSSLRWAELQLGASRVFIAPIIIDSVQDSACRQDSHNQIDGTSNESDCSLFYGLSDRIFRATSGVSIQLVVEGD